MGSQTLIDAQVTYYLDENLEFTLGVDNLFDDYPDENPGAGSTGQLYPEDSPFGFNGGTWYLRGRYAF